ncbi:SDR family NAD(P)-dependent oxidoreductase, partial [Tahibacter harae]
MSGSFPMAADLTQFWHNLRDGRDCISEIPADRWDWRAIYGDPLREPGKTNIKWGGFVDGVGEFDPLFFGIAPRDAEVMDPQQRLLLTHAWRAIEDAGYSAQSLWGSRTAVFVGVGDSGYSSIVAQANVPVGGSGVTLGVPSFGPNRVSHFLNLHGPSEPIETACSSSLVAIHRALLSLHAGQCDLALVGGVHIMLTPWAHLNFSRAGVLAVDGRCKTFSAQADGYVRGDGVGMLLLKPLDAAERDEDLIYGLIVGSAENHGGRANSLTAPNPKAQAALLRTAYTEAGVDPRSVGYIEAHGTGTSLGDPVEISALKAAFKDLYAASGSAEVAAPHIALGAVKTNIGHLEFAAGVAGVIKLLLQLQHRTLAPSLHCAEVNPFIDLRGTPFRLLDRAQEWPLLHDAQGQPLPRRGGVSSFGLGGVNAHVIIEEYRAVPAAPPAPPAAVLIVLSARTEAQLAEQCRRLLAALDEGRYAEEDLAGIAYTLQAGREAMDWRLGFVAASLAALREGLRRHAAGEAVDDGASGDIRRSREALAAFGSDEELAEAQERWIARGRLGRLAEYWVRGGSVDWNRLYPQGRPRRLRLPTYAFSRERHWVPLGDAGWNEVALAAFAPGPHVLLQRNVSDFASQAYATRLDGSEFFLRDHVIRGSHIVPGVTWLEMARAALADAAGLGAAAGNGLVLSQVVWPRPLAVAGDAVDVRIELAPQPSGEVAFAIRSEGADGEAPVHCQGRAALAETPPERLDLARWQAHCGEWIPGEVAYAALPQIGFAFGPGLRALQRQAFGVDADGAPFALAQLQLPDAVAAGAAGYVLHPSLLDAAVGLLPTPAAAQALLPFVLEQIEVLAPCPAQAWVLIRHAPGSSSADAVQKFDIDIADADGAVAVRLRRFCRRQLDLSAAAGTSTLLLAPQWREAAAPAGGTAPAAHHLWLLATDAEPAQELAVAAAAAFPAAQVATIAAPGSAAQAFEQAALGLLARLQSLAAGAAGSVLVQLVVPAADPLLAGLAGLLKSARQELASLTVQLFLREDGGTAALIAQLGAWREGGHAVLRLAQDGCLIEDVAEIQAGAETAGAGHSPWKEQGVYLISGGGAGLGLKLAQEIARCVQRPRLVLLGRRAPDAALDAALAALNDAGAAAEYHAVDIADRVALDATVAALLQRHGRLDGVLHAAGVVRDSYLAAKTAAELSAVFAPKVAGLVNLDEATAALDLDLFVAFSSVVGQFGNAGQADYAAANAFMDHYLRQRAAQVARGERRGRSLSVNWPLWRDGGMQVAAAVREQMQRLLGLAPLDTSTGWRLLDAALASGLAQVAVVCGDAPRIRQTLLAAPALAPARTESAPAAAAGEDQLARIYALLVEVIVDLAKVDRAEIFADVSLNTLGFDSIGFTEFSNRLNHQFGLSLAPTVFFEHSTPAALARYLAARHASQLLGAAAAAAATAPAAAAGAARAVPLHAT